MKVPHSLADLIDRRRGQEQQAISWPQGRWKRACSSHAVLGNLPPTLDRKRVRLESANAGTSESAAMNAFLATMVWGYGNVGYGAWRVTQALKDGDAGRKLLDVVTALNSDGPEAAYRLMAGASRLHRIGPAFGTKFLYFADLGIHLRRALILDALVAEWLGRNTNFRVDPVPWAPAKYGEYLEKMHDWAHALTMDPDAVELAIFQEMSDRDGNQWSRSKPV